jgi:hypothetical protein
MSRHETTEGTPSGYSSPWPVVQIYEPTIEVPISRLPEMESYIDGHLVPMPNKEGLWIENDRGEIVSISQFLMSGFFSRFGLTREEQDTFFKRYVPGYGEPKKPDATSGVPKTARERRAIQAKQQGQVPMDLPVEEQPITEASDFLPADTATASDQSNDIDTAPGASVDIFNRLHAIEGIMAGYATRNSALYMDDARKSGDSNEPFNKQYKGQTTTKGKPLADHVANVYKGRAINSVKDRVRHIDTLAATEAMKAAGFSKSEVKDYRNELAADLSKAFSSSGREYVARRRRLIRQVGTLPRKIEESEQL